MLVAVAVSPDPRWSRGGRPPESGDGDRADAERSALPRILRRVLLRRRTDGRNAHGLLQDVRGGEEEGGRIVGEESRVRSLHQGRDRLGRR